MYEVLGFVVTVGALLTDPIALVGYVLVGAFVRQLYAALIAAFVWSIAMEMLVTAITSSATFGDPPVFVFARIVGGFIVVSAVWLIARQIRRNRSRTGGTGD